MDKKLQSKYGLLAIIAVCVTIIICVMLMMPEKAKEQTTASLDNSNYQEECSHVWSESTCTKPQKCSLCGLEGGNSRGHQWLEATCESPKRCENCGEIQGQKLEHNWEKATASNPMKCSLCGITRGEIKKYSGGKYGAMSQEWISFSKWDVHPYVMSVKTENCISFTMTLSIWNVEYGSPYGTWEVYCKDKSGSWVHVEDVDIQNNMTTIEINLDEPMTFTEVAINRASTKGCKHSYEIDVISYSVCDE